jgi:hypothetical protein
MTDMGKGELPPERRRQLFLRQLWMPSGEGAVAPALDGSDPRIAAIAAPGELRVLPEPGAATVPALRSDLVKLVSRWNEGGVKGRRLISLVRVFRMTRLLHRMLDESEFLSPYGVRALSRSYLDQPYDFECDGVHYRVTYEPGESDGALFGGNSNWRGPVWMPVNYLLIENLRRFYQFYGDGSRSNVRPDPGP